MTHAAVKYKKLRGTIDRNTVTVSEWEISFVHVIFAGFLSNYKRRQIRNQHWVKRKEKCMKHES